MIKICTFSLRWLSGWQLLMSACSHVHTHSLSLSHTNTYTQTHTAKPSLTQSTIRLWMTVLGPPAVSCGGITVCSLSFSWNVHPALTFKQITSFLLKTTLIHLLSVKPWKDWIFTRRGSYAMNLVCFPAPRSCTEPRTGLWRPGYKSGPNKWSTMDQLLYIKK